MKPVLSFVCAALFAATPLVAQGVETDESNAVFESLIMSDTDNLTEFLWQARPIVVFADSPNDPRFEQQMALLEEQAAALKTRDVVILTDTDPQNASELRKSLRPRGFMMVLIGKDGGVKLRKPFPWNVREITRSIDKMPLRQQEIKDRRVAQ